MASHTLLLAMLTGARMCIELSKGLHVPTKMAWNFLLLIALILWKSIFLVWRFFLFRWSISKYIHSIWTWGAIWNSWRGHVCITSWWSTASCIVNKKMRSFNKVITFVTKSVRLVWVHFKALLYIKTKKS